MTNLQERLTRAKQELQSAEQLVLRAQQAQHDAVVQQLRLQGQIAILEELIEDESRGQS
jgi:hypothetical protein